MVETLTRSNATTYVWRETDASVRLLDYFVIGSELDLMLRCCSPVGGLSLIVV